MSDATEPLRPEHVIDRHGFVWRVVRDGGMATRADYIGITSIGIEELRATRGPLIELEEALARSTPAEALDVERLIDTSAAALVLDGVRQLQRERGRLSKVTVEDMRRLLLLIVDASARLSPQRGGRPMTDTPAAPTTPECEHRKVEGLTNWTDDGNGGTKPDGVFWYCKECGDPFVPARSTSAEALPPCPICGKSDLFIGTDGKPGCPHCEVAVTLPRSTPSETLDVLREALIEEGLLADDEPSDDEYNRQATSRILARLSHQGGRP